MDERPAPQGSKRPTVIRHVTRKSNTPQANRNKTLDKTTIIDGTRDESHRSAVMVGLVPRPTLPCTRKSPFVPRLSRPLSSPTVGQQAKDTGAEQGKAGGFGDNTDGCHAEPPIVAFEVRN
jgi:hypothetical protein